MARNDKKPKVEDLVETEGDETAGNSKTYTYIGGGEASPNVINFMGQQKFVRGQAVEVSNPELLNKLENHPCFVAGEMSLEEIHNRDTEAAEKAEAQRAEDKRVQANFKKQQKALTPRGEEE